MSNAITPSRKTDYAVFGISAVTGVGGAVYLTTKSDNTDWFKVVGCLFLAGVGLFGLSRLRSATVVPATENRETEKAARVALEKFGSILKSISKTLEMDVGLPPDDELSLDIVISKLSLIHEKIGQLKESESANTETIQSLEERLQTLTNQLEELTSVENSPTKDAKLLAALETLNNFNILDESDSSERSNPNTPTASPIKKKPTSRTGTPVKTQTPSNNLFG